MRKGDRKGGVIEQVTTVDKRSSVLLGCPESQSGACLLGEGSGSGAIYQALTESCALDVLIPQHCRSAAGWQSRCQWQVMPSGRKTQGVAVGKAAGVHSHGKLEEIWAGPPYICHKTHLLMMTPSSPITLGSQSPSTE